MRLACSPSLSRALPILIVTLLCAAVPLRAQPPAHPKKPLYFVENLGDLHGSFTQAEAVGDGGGIVGQAQTIRYIAPTMVGTPLRRKYLSYFDPNEGYTNRQNINVLALVYILANPQYLRWYYSDRRLAAERKIDEERGVIFTPRPVGTPVVLSQGYPQELPTPVDRGGVALGRNIAGVVVGAVRYSPVSDTLHAAVWLPAGEKPVSYRFVDLEASKNESLSIACGVNAAGEVVGGADSGYGVLRAFRWADLSRDLRGALVPGIRQNLGTLGGPRSAARAINASGRIVGWAEHRTGLVQGFSWEPTGGENGTLFPLQTPPTFPEGTQSEAYAINANGYSVGVAYLPDGTRRAMRWDKQNRAAPLPPLPGAASTEATALNDMGLVVGFAYDATAPRQTQPDTEVDLAAFPATAADLLAPPEIPGPPVSTWAVVWDGVLVRDLNTLVDPRSGWILRRATGITNRGEIVGWGTYKGKVRAFRLKPLFASVNLPR